MHVQVSSLTYFFVSVAVAVPYTKSMHQTDVNTLFNYGDIDDVSMCFHRED